MALHPNRPARNALPQRPILGHPDLPPNLPLRPARHPNAHAKRTLPALDAALPLHLRLPPKELQSSLGSQHDSNRPAEFHDEQRDDDGVTERQ